MASANSFSANCKPFQQLFFLCECRQRRRMLIQISRSYGAPRFKPKMLRNKPLRTPSMLALDHFDFYYKPLFGDLWPSIRLGLLTPNKFIAVLNGFSQSLEFNQEMIHKIGAMNLTDSLTHGKTGGTLPPEVEQRRQKVEQQITKFMSRLSVDQPVSEGTDFANDNSSTKFPTSKDDIVLRTQSMGLRHYREPVHQFSQSDLQKYKSEEELDQIERRLVRDTEFEVTGLEAVNLDANLLPTTDDFIVYPRDLQLFVQPQKSLDGYPRPVSDKRKISSWWLLDGGSIIPVLALNLQETDIVLDMCAAPGGKSLLIAQTKKFSNLVSNDNKLHRIGQLKRGLEMYIPVDSEVADRITIKKKDASTVEGWDELGMYDKVLVDAPCTTDRLSANYDEGNIFATPLTNERLSLPQLQTRMLVNALRSVRVGGSVVYSTCTLAPTQNEAVVENAAVLADKYYGIRCVERSLKSLQRHLTQTGLFRFYDACPRGILLLPWILSNFGPMYVCKLQRLK